MRSFVADLHYAARAFRKSPVFLTVAVLALGLALGITTTAFGVFDAVTHPYVPFTDAKRIYWIGDGGAGYDGLTSIRNEGRTHSGMALVSRNFSTVGRGELTTDVSTAFVSPNLFDVLGVRVKLGRTFIAIDSTHPEENVAVINDRLWNMYRGADRSPRNLELNVDGRSYTVIGVLPRGDYYPMGAEIYLPIPANRAAMPPGFGFFGVFRLAPGKTEREVRRELSFFAARQTLALHSERHPVEYLLRRADENRNRDGLSDVQIALGGAVALVLLIACANLAQLLLSRGLANQRELALRSALGASRARLVRQLFAECVLITLGGGLVGALFAFWSTAVAASLLPPSIQRLGIIVPQLSWRVFVFGFAGALLTVLLFGLVPALRASRADPNDALKNGATTTARHGHRYSALVMTEAALSLVLLLGAGLLVRTAHKLYQFDYGYNARGLVAAENYPNKFDYPTGTSLARLRSSVIASLSALPEVDAAATLQEQSLGRGRASADVPGIGVVEHYLQYYRAVSLGFFRTLRVPMIAGRDFEPGDARTGAIVLDSGMAAVLFGPENPVGRMVKLADARSASPWLHVVGVVRSFYLRPEPDEAPQPAIFAVVPGDSARGGYSLIVRGHGPIGTLAVDVRRQVRTIMADALPPRVARWTADLESATERTDFLAALLIAFSCFGLLIAGVGLYGVVAHTVSQRMREFGVRVALGAEARHLRQLVLHDGAVMLLAGTAIGGLVAPWAAWKLDLRLFGFDGYLAVTLIIAECLLVGVGLLACWTPARRAAKADPIEVLRAI